MRGEGPRARAHPAAEDGTARGAVIHPVAVSTAAGTDGDQTTAKGIRGPMPGPHGRGAVPGPSLPCDGPARSRRSGTLPVPLVDVFAVASAPGAAGVRVWQVTSRERQPSVDYSLEAWRH